MQPEIFVVLLRCDDTEPVFRLKRWTPLGTLKMLYVVDTENVLDLNSAGKWKGLRHEKLQQL
jgi:hypothetical protein